MVTRLPSVVAYFVERSVVFGDNVVHDIPVSAVDHFPGLLVARSPKPSLTFDMTRRTFLSNV
jgi:hypothetical protein